MTSTQRSVLCFVTIFATLMLGATGCRNMPGQATKLATNEPVGQLGTNRWYTPANQILTPTGIQVELPGLRPQAIALSPDGKFFVTAGKTKELVVVDPRTGDICQRVPLPSEKDQDPQPDGVSTHILEPDKEGQVSFTGLVFSPDGKRIYLANVNGSIKVFGVEHGTNVVGLFTLPLPPADAPKRKVEIPSGLALSPDGRRLYVCGNLSNRLLELDATTGAVLKAWDVGVAPYDVVLVRNKAYVSNWGGRRPDARSVTGPAGRGTLVRVDPVRHIANEGSVSVIELDAKSEIRNEDILKVLKTLGNLTRSTLKPKDFSAILKSIKGTPGEEIINYIVLRSLKQARYSSMNAGHFGLASASYSHFTSPMALSRPGSPQDLRVILTHKILSDRRKKELESLLPDIAFSSSRMERLADDAENVAVKAMRGWFRKERAIGEEFEGNVVDVSPYGLRVRLKEFYVEGFLNLSSLTDDYYQYNDKTMRLSGRHTRRSFRLGQELRLRVDRVDMEEREIIFSVL